MRRHTSRTKTHFNCVSKIITGRLEGDYAKVQSTLRLIQLAQSVKAGNSIRHEAVPRPTQAAYLSKDQMNKDMYAKKLLKKWGNITLETFINIQTI